MTRYAYPIREQIQITEMYSLFLRHYEHDYVFPGESHDFWECVYVQNGEICAADEGSVYNLTGGDIIFHKPLNYHKFFVTSEAGADLIIFSFKGTGPLTVWLQNKTFHLSQGQQEIIGSMYRYLVSQFGENNNKINVHSRFYLEQFSASFSASHMTVTYLYQLMLSLFETNHPSAPSEAPDAVIFRKAIKYLHNHVYDHPTVSEIAVYCNISAAGLKRIFAKYADDSVHKYLLKLKVNTAAALLCEGESVTEVAEKLGFSSYSSFSKMFKRECGYSPSELKCSNTSKLPTI